MSLQYITGIQKMIEKIKQTQLENIGRAAEITAEAIANGHLIYTFGTGHSALMLWEGFYRKGVFMQMLPMLDHGLAMYSGARRSAGYERLTGYAKILFDDYEVEPGDVIVVISNSGINAAPVEMAIEAGKKGITTVAITCMETSTVLPPDPGNVSGKKLYEVASLVIDTCGYKEDSFVHLEGMRATVGADSTVLNAVIMQSLITQTAKCLLDRGIVPAIAMRLYAEGAQEYNERILGPVRERLKGRLRHV